MKLLKSAALLLLCLAGAGAEAHGLWLAQRAGQWAAVYGEGAEDEAYDPAAIGQVAAWTPEGQAAAWRSGSRAGLWTFVPEQAVAQLVFRYDAGEWTETTDGRWLAGGRAARIGEARRTWRLQRYASALLVPTTGPATPRGLPLEIVPQQALAGLRKGDLLPLRVLLRGRPLAGAKLIADFVNDDQAPAARTDADGIVRIRLGSNGLNVVQASHAEDCPGECTVDRIAHSTTLSFSVARLPE